MALLLSLSTAAQSKVPFVGCPADGQIDHIEAPKGKDVPVPLDRATASKLSYYSAFGMGVLAPRGWHCYGNYGSSGEILFVTPKPLDFEKVRLTGFTGPVIGLSYADPGASGLRFDVVPVIARVFPEWRRYIQEIIEEMDLPTTPYPNSEIVARTNRAVEFRTASNAEGLGTRHRVQPNDQPILGTAVLVGTPPPYLVELSVRLPENSQSLAKAIIEQLERDAPKFGH